MPLDTIDTPEASDQSQVAREKRHGLVGPADLWEMKRDFQIRFLRSRGLKPEHRILDLGCGTLRGGLPLIEYLEDGHYVGVDTRNSVLDEAKMELHEAGLEIKQPTLLLSTDLSQFSIGREFDFIWAFSVLFHLSDDILRTAFGFVERHLAEDGVFFANVLTERQPKNHRWQGFPVITRELATYELCCTEFGLAQSDLGRLSEHGHESRNRLADNQRMLVFTRK